MDYEEDYHDECQSVYVECQLHQLPQQLKFQFFSVSSQQHSSQAFRNKTQCQTNNSVYKWRHTKLTSLSVNFGQQRLNHENMYKIHVTNKLDLILN